MHLVVLSPDKEIFDGQAESVKVPGTDGQFEVLENHAPIVAALGTGEVTVRKEQGGVMSFTIAKGFIDVLYNEVSLLVQGVSEEKE